MTRQNGTVLVTGAASGIGLATANLFKEDGWSVIAVDRQDPECGADLCIQTDISQPDEVERLVSDVRSRYPGLDVLVNNAACQIVRPLLDTHPEEWDNLLSTNLKSAYLLARGLYPLLEQVTGSIVNVASIHAKLTSPGMSAYAASKGGLVALTRAMALEFASVGIRANAVLPGAVDTPMLAAGLRRADLFEANEQCSLDALARKHPLGRVGRPIDIAHAIRFLADRSRAAFVTGQTLTVDGGAAARLSTE